MYITIYVYKSQPLFYAALRDFRTNKFSISCIFFVQAYPDVGITELQADAAALSYEHEHLALRRPDGGREQIAREETALLKRLGTVWRNALVRCRRETQRGLQTGSRLLLSAY